MIDFPPPLKTLRICCQIAGPHSQYQWSEVMSIWCGNSFHSPFMFQTSHVKQAFKINWKKVYIVAVERWSKV